MLSCQEKLVFLFVNQNNLVKSTELRYIYVHGFILQLKIGSTSVVDFCVSQKEILIGIELGRGLPLYPLHYLIFPAP